MVTKIKYSHRGDNFSTWVMAWGWAEVMVIAIAGFALAGGAWIMSIVLTDRLAPDLLMQLATIALSFTLFGVCVVLLFISHTLWMIMHNPNDLMEELQKEGFVHFEAPDGSVFQVEFVALVTGPTHENAFPVLLKHRPEAKKFNEYALVRSLADLMDMLGGEMESEDGGVLWSVNDPAWKVLAQIVRHKSQLGEKVLIQEQGNFSNLFNASAAKARAKS